MLKNFRQFYRHPSNSFCLIETDSHLIKAQFVDYSQMGCLLRLEKLVSIKKQIALIYQKDKSEYVKMACLSIHLHEKHGLFYLGVKFIAQISR
ncbi:hypothetical protein CIK05_02155 [Bdellovibrio sp. qaytius]|nr:hypothetical protein CIK05_02155 [Bdellovibrio sp. qaytius]